MFGMTELRKFSRDYKSLYLSAVWFSAAFLFEFWILKMHKREVGVLVEHQIVNLSCKLSDDWPWLWFGFALGFRLDF